MSPRSNTCMSVKDVLFWAFLLSSNGAAALQQQPSDAYPVRPAPAAEDLSSKASTAIDERWKGLSSDDSLSGQRGYRDTHTRVEKAPVSERALATLSPAETDPAVRAPPAPKSAVSTDGLTTRQAARSLQDWQVEDILLLATVDGTIHARDRRTGAPRWRLETDRPMVETIYHRNNKSLDENETERDPPDALWIVEPSQDGSMYIYAPGSGIGMQRLGFTVKQLAELAPYASDGQPAVVYTAAKKNALYTVDASTGSILKSFSSAGLTVNEDRSCKRVSPLESLDDDACEPIGTLTLGRTEYEIGVQDRNTNERISTIRYFEWGPNNRDQDLLGKYKSSMDNMYIYTKYDGTVFGLDLATTNDYDAVPANKPVYRHKLSSPVARIYDIVRPNKDMSSEASLVVLPQPVGPSPNDFSRLDNNYLENVFVNCTDTGSWYALSETNYPTVTEGASEAQCYLDDAFNLPHLTLPMSKRQRERFAGIHQLSLPTTQKPGGHSVGGTTYAGIDAPREEMLRVDDGTNVEPSSSMSSIRALLLSIVLAAFACGALYSQKSPKLPRVPHRMEFPKTIQSLPVEAQPVSTTEEQPMVREAEPAKETIFPFEEAVEDAPREESPESEELARAESTEAIPVNGAEEEKDVQEPKKKKATRGKRGGKKQKEKYQQQAEARAKRANSQPQLQAPTKATDLVISVAASESPQVSGPLQINSLVIHTDKVIGTGSCGTCVFEGSFEGRDVAVKRMLSQYYELASQEVSFLQQSDDHPNVVRYFCQQKDDHFLYIAVELCQASLFDVWEGEKARTDERYAQMNELKLAIQQDVPSALQQLAAGLYHLHNLRIIHRDIKPQNILVAFPKRNQNTGPRLVISDFGLGKNLPENVSTLIDPTGNAGTSGWKAPELISQPRETDSRHSQSQSHQGGSESANGHSGSGVKRAADIFSLGCLFFWVLTDGTHPYEDENGWQQLRELNIKRDNKKIDVLARWSDAYEPMQLIESMLEHQPEHRPTALQVLNHPFFWPAEKRLAFLCDCSDHFEREPRGTIEDNYAGDSAQLRLLESRVRDVIIGASTPVDFLAKLDRHFVDTLGKQRKYSGNRLLDLLRALRNKKNHYEDMPEEVKRKVGPLPGGYLSYWSNRFPRLLMACFEVVHEARIQGNDRFKGYFTVGSAGGR